MRNTIFVSLFSAFFTVALFMSCTNPENPFLPKNTKLTLSVINSKGEESTSKSFTDTLGKKIVIKLEPFLYTNIDSVKITVTKQGGGQDFAFSALKFLSDTSIQTFPITLTSPGLRTVKAVAYIGSGTIVQEASIDFVIVARPILVTLQPTNISQYETGVAKFKVTVTNYDTSYGYSYLWRKNGIVVPSATTDSLVFASLVKTDAATYTCTVKDKWFDSTVSNDAVLTVTPGLASILISSQPASVSVAENAKALFNIVIVNKDSTYSFAWNKNGIPIVDATKDTFVINAVTFADSGSYTCVVKKGSDVVTSSAAILTVTAVAGMNHPPKINVEGVLNILPSQICSLTVSATDADSGQTKKFTMSNGPTGATFVNNTFKWQPAATFLGKDSATFVVMDNGTPAMGDSLKVIITVKASIIVDVTKPVISMVIPAKDSVITNSSSYTVTLKSTDASGVASVNGLMGTTAFTGVRGSGDSWTVSLTGLAPNVFNTIVFTAIDSSEKANKETLTLHIKNDPTMSDVDGPSIKLISGPGSGSVITSPVVSITDSIFDPSGVDSVYWTVNGVKAGMLSVGSNNTFALVDTLTMYHFDTVTIYAQDKSAKHNMSVQSIILNYNAVPTWKHKIQTASVNENATFSMSLVDSVNNQDSDPLTFTVLGTSVGSISQNVYSYAPTFADSGLYVVKIKASDAVSSDTLVLNLHVANVNRQPELSGVADINVIVGAAVNFIVTATDADGDKVTLSVTGTLPPGATFTAATGAFAWAQSAAGAFPLTFTANDGTGTISKAITISVSNNPKPNIATDPVAKAVCMGATDSFYVKASGAGTLTYQWQKNGVSVSGETKSSIKLTNIDITDTGSYTCLVANDGGTVISKAGKLTVNIPSTTPVAQATKTSVCLNNNSVTLSLKTGTLGTGATWKWYSPKSSSTALTSLLVTPTNSQWYFVHAENGVCGAGTTPWDSVYIEVKAAPTISISPTTSSVTQGTNATFTAVATGSGALSYQWQKGSTTFTDLTGETKYQLTTGITGVYRCVVKDECTSVTSNTANLTVNSTYTVTYDANSGTGSVPTDAAKYTTGSVVTVLGQGALLRTGYSFGGWTNNGTLVGATFSMGNANVVLTAKWDASQPTVTMQTPTTTCTNATLAVNASGSGVLKYQWYKDNVIKTGATVQTITVSEKGVYKCTVTDGFGGTRDASVTYNGALALTLSATSKLVCPNAKTTLTATAIGGTPDSKGEYRYYWSVSPDNGWTASVKSPIITMDENWFTDKYVFSCLVTDSKDCTVTATIDVTQDFSGTCPP